MSKFVRHIDLEIGGEVRHCKFDINAIQRLEAMIPEKNVFQLIAKDAWSISEIVNTCFCGLATYNKKLTLPKVQEWVSKYAVENANGIHKLRSYLLAAIGLSGLVGGERSAFEDILTALQNFDENGEPQEANDEEGEL